MERHVGWGVEVNVAWGLTEDEFFVFPVSKGGVGYETKGIIEVSFIVVFGTVYDVIMTYGRRVMENVE